MSKDEALKLALEALEEAWYHVGTFQPTEKAIDLYDEARTAIKEALAQPEHGWTPERIAGMARLKDAQDKKLAQPEQEPVAWMDDYNACKCPDNEARCFSDKVFRMMQKHTDSLAKQQEPVAKVCHDLDGHIGWNPNLKQLPNEGTPLYTSPPQRKPEQEPVTWRYKIVDVFGRPAWTLKTPKSDTRVLESQPLYTTPPPVAEPHKRKPLTEAELERLYDAHAKCQEYGAWVSGWFEFARAIEAAHGIKGEPCLTKKQ